MWLYKTFIIARRTSLFLRMSTHIRERWKCLFVVCVKEAGHNELTPEHTVQLLFFFLMVKCFFVFKLTYWILWTFDESQGCLFSNGRTYAERILKCQLTDRINVEIHFWNVNFYGYICGRQWNNHIIHFLKSPCLNYSLLKRDAKCKLSTTMNKGNIILLELVKDA